MYTQCPDCQTAFRVTNELLQKAGGRVRCGGCGHAFSAVEHLYEELPVPGRSAPRGNEGERRSGAAHGPDPERRRRELLESLDRLAGDSDVRIEDTGIEWRVLENADEEEIVIEDTPIPDNDDEGQGGPRIGAQRSLDLGDTAADDEPRYDDNTPLPDDFEDSEEAPYVPPVPRRRAEDRSGITDFDTHQIDLAMGEEDDWAGLLDDEDGAGHRDTVDDGDVDPVPAVPEAPPPARRPVNPADSQIPFEVEEELVAIHSELLGAASAARRADSMPDDAREGAGEMASAEEVARDGDGPDTGPETGDEGDFDDELTPDEEADIVEKLRESTGAFQKQIEAAQQALERGDIDFYDAPPEPPFRKKTDAKKPSARAYYEVGPSDDERDDDTKEPAGESHDAGSPILDLEDEQASGPPPRRPLDDETGDEPKPELSLEDDTAGEPQPELSLEDEPADGADSGPRDDADEAQPEAVEDAQEALSQEEKLAQTMRLAGIDPAALEAGNIETIIMEGEQVRDVLDSEEQEALEKLSSSDSLIDTYMLNKGHVRGGRRKGDPPGVGTIAAAAALALLLAAQWMHHSRGSFATFGFFNQTLGPIYRAIGSPVTPEWNVKGWRFVNTRGSADANNDLLTIFSSVTNASDQPLPYPLLHVSLTDRFEEIIGSKVLEPGEYLAGDLDPRRPVVPGDRFNAVIAIRAPSAEATGFKLNVCYRVSPGRVRCATEDFKD